MQWEEYSEAGFIDWVKIIPKKWFKVWLIHFGLIKYLLKNSKTIDILNLFHFSSFSLIYWIIYKIINKKWILYLRLDYNINWFKNNGDRIYNINPIINFLFKPFENLLINICDIISVEVEEWVKLLSNYNSRFSKKIIRLPNWADDINIKDTVKSIKKYKEKENLIITIWRIWTYQKNTEILLDILEKINLKDWKVKIIWTIEENFIPKIKDFFNKNPKLKEKIEFTWAKSKKEVYEYYNKAKIFILTSRYEWFANIFPEALYFWNYIITTDVSWAQDITKKWKIGEIVPIGDIKTFKEKLQKAINKKEVVENAYSDIITYSRNTFTRSKITERLQKALLYDKK